MSADPTPARFGPHTCEVEDVIEFVEAGKVLSASFDPDRAKGARFDPLVVSSLEGIEFYRDPFLPGARISGRNWHPDVKSVDDVKYGIARGYTADFEVSRRLAPLFQSEGERFLELLRRQLGDLLPDLEIDFIAQDMEILVRRRADTGVTHLMHERFFKVYQAGGYPCGWEGRYPKGRLVVLSR